MTKLNQRIAVLNEHSFFLLHPWRYRIFLLAKHVIQRSASREYRASNEQYPVTFEYIPMIHNWQNNFLRSIRWNTDVCIRCIIYTERKNTND